MTSSGRTPTPDPSALPRHDAPQIRWAAWAVAMGADAKRVAKMSAQQIRDEFLTAD